MSPLPQSNVTSETRAFFIFWIILIIISIIIKIILDVIFLYLPVSRVEQVVTKTAADIEIAVQRVEMVANDVDQVSKDIENLINESLPLINAAKDLLCSLCNNPLIQPKPQFCSSSFCNGNNNSTSGNQTLSNRTGTGTSININQRPQFFHRS